MVQPSSGEPNSPRFVPALRFRSLTPLYDFVVGLTMREHLLRPGLIRALELQPGTSVLELGCGTGTLTVQIKLAEPRATVTGLDPDPVVLRIAATKAHKAGIDLRLEQGSAASLPFEAGEFHVVVSSLAFHHQIPTVKRMALAEARCVLHPGGHLWIVDFGPPRTRIGQAATLPLRILDGRTNTEDNFQGRLPQLIEAAGFQQVAEVRRIHTVVSPVCFYSAVKKEDGL